MAGGKTVVFGCFYKAVLHYHAHKTRVRNLLAAAVGRHFVFIDIIHYHIGILLFANDYTCAWGPADNVRPKMIRLTIVIDDPNGRLPDGQTYEYVFSLPPAERDREMMNDE